MGINYGLLRIIVEVDNPPMPTAHQSLNLLIKENHVWTGGEEQQLLFSEHFFVTISLCLQKHSLSIYFAMSTVFEMCVVENWHRNTLNK